MDDLGTGCLTDVLTNWLLPKTPWKAFVLLVIVAAAVTAVAVFQSR